MKSVIGKDSFADSKGGWKVERTRRREPRKCRNFALLSFWGCCSATFAFKLEYISQKLPHKPQWHNCIYIWKLGSLQIVKPDITDDDTFNDHCEIFRKNEGNFHSVHSPKYQLCPKCPKRLVIKKEKHFEPCMFLNIHSLGSFHVLEYFIWC